MADRALPTEPGSVIGWSTYYDGNHYCTAVLTWADVDDGMALRWWLAGFPEPRTAEEMAKVGSWEDLGVLRPSRTFARPA